MTTEIRLYRGQFTTYFTLDKVDPFKCIITLDSASRVVKSHFRRKLGPAGVQDSLRATKMPSATRNQVPVETRDVSAYEIEET